MIWWKIVCEDFDDIAHNNWLLAEARAKPMLDETRYTALGYTPKERSDMLIADIRADIAEQEAKYNPSEQEEIIRIFSDMLRYATRDGGKKRKAGLKPPWYLDPSHEAALFSHLAKWKKGERTDSDSGAHPLVHLAWRALAIAVQEMDGGEVR